MSILDWLRGLFGRKPPILPPDTGPVGSIEAMVISMHNTARKSEGKPPLKRGPALSKSAQVHAEAMAANSRETHSSLGDGTMQERAARFGYHGALAENIDAGPFTPQVAFTQWMEDPPHRANILGPYQDIGFGSAANGQIIYYCVDFGSPA